MDGSGIGCTAPKIELFGAELFLTGYVSHWSTSCVKASAVDVLMHAVEQLPVSGLLSP